MYAPAGEEEIKIENEVFLPAYQENIGDVSFAHQTTGIQSKVLNVSIFKLKVAVV